MARETHVPPSSGRHARRSQYPLRGQPWRGASLEAPTAPHATDPLSPPKVKTGPARFWDARRMRIVTLLAIAISLGCHWWAVPFRLWNVDAGVDFKNAEGELGIPLDLLGDDVEQKEDPAPPPVTPPVDPTQSGPNKAKDGGAPKPDASASTDASIPDASVHDASESGDAGAADAAVVAMNDAGSFPGTAGARDPASAVGLSEVINAGPQNVVLVINTALIRTNSIGARMGPVLQQIPQWKDFLKGSQTAVDPIRDTDWILIYGPSLIHTDRDAVLVRYNIADSAVDQVVDGIAKGYDKGGPYDAGVPGMRASLGYGDNAQRVFLRPQPKLLVIVPPSHAHAFAKSYAKQSPRGPAPTEAVRLIVRSPSNQVSIRGLSLSQSLKELRLWVVPRADGSADVFAEGDCTDETAAITIAQELTNELARMNALGFGPFTVSMVTRGLLDKAQVDPDGKKVKLHIVATPQQLEAILQLAAGQVGATVPPPTTPP